MVVLYWDVGLIKVKFREVGKSGGKGFIYFGLYYSCFVWGVSNGKKELFWFEINLGII